MFTNRELFTSESVCSGHADKICDAISDAILDEALKQDRDSRTGIEAIVGADRIALFGEIHSRARLDFEAIAREVVERLGYVVPDWGFSNQSALDNYIHHQSPDISLGVDKGGAGDQGMMFGFAINETDNFMPLPIAIAHEITKAIDHAREHKGISWLRPDGKAQVTVEYKANRPVSIVKLVAAIAHSEDIIEQEVKEHVIKEIFEPVVNQFGFELPNSSRDIVVNGTGRWHIPGPASDAGLTGRKIVVDTYGGYSRVGGGAFSGKDPSKVDRSGAYAARFIAKNIVANGLADKCEVGLAYVIGHPKPLMQTINTFGTSKTQDSAIRDYASSLIDTSVNGIIDALNLKQPIYSKTSAYGHFGKPDLPWERLV